MGHIKMKVLLNHLDIISWKNTDGSKYTRLIWDIKHMFRTRG